MNQGSLTASASLMDDRFVGRSRNCFGSQTMQFFDASQTLDDFQEHSRPI